LTVWDDLAEAAATIGWARSVVDGAAARKKFLHFCLNEVLSDAAEELTPGSACGLSADTMTNGTPH
jgi:hypothetical protein